MDPKIWGRNLWTSLIYIGKGYPERPTDNDKNDYYIFYSSLARVLPCKVCRINYAGHFHILPPQLESRDELLRWIHAIYNRTLAQKGLARVSYDEFMNKYMSRGNNILYMIIAVLIVIIIVILFYYFYKKGKEY